MEKNDRTSWAMLGITLAGACWILLVNGAVPLVGTPTMGQAASMLGYAEAFADQPWYSVRAAAFGYPTPTGLATGLPLAWLAGWFVRLRLSASDAYTATVACWLLIGYAGARRLAARLDADSVLATLAGATWMTLPMVWWHQGYSSLALGMALLPLYLLSAWVLYDEPAHGWRRLRANAAFVATCIVALFMDGYTFVMFVVGSSMLFAFRFLEGESATRWRVVKRVAPVYVLGFAGAYVVYTRYMGYSGYSTAPLDFFRAWGLDLVFLVQPSSGNFWFWDWLGWSVNRSQVQYFGDESVWCTTFALPLALAGMACFFAVRARDRRAWLFLALGVVGLYLSLGPSLKVDATKPPGWTDQLMPATAAVMPTGSAALAARVPGFRNMRAAYRWEALFLLGMWALVVLTAARSGQRRAWAWRAGYVLLILSNAPHLRYVWDSYRDNRRGLTAIDDEVVAPMAKRLPPGTRVFFVPYGNDVMANYLSPKLDIVTYNVGGDKQIDPARQRWPAKLQHFWMDRFDTNDLPLIRAALVDGDVDAVVIPYFNSLWAAHEWPCPAGSNGHSSNPAFLCPPQIRANDAGKVAMLANDDMLMVDDQPLFAIVRLKPAFAKGEGHRRAWERVLADVSYPLNVVKEPDSAALVLGDGWHGREPANRWSSEHAELMIPVPVACRKGGCEISLRFWAFAASGQRPVKVSFSLVDSAGKTRPVETTIQDEGMHTVGVPVPSGMSVVEIAVDVPAAASPEALGKGSDTRTLGISLLHLNVRPTGEEGG